jgi:hypothetical protein
MMAGEAPIALSRNWGLPCYVLRLLAVPMTPQGAGQKQSRLRACTPRERPMVKLKKLAKIVAKAEKKIAKKAAKKAKKSDSKVDRSDIPPTSSFSS